MARITRSPHMVFYERIEALLDTLYKGSRPEEREKRKALSRIVRYASRQRGAWMNCEIVSPPLIHPP